MRGRVKRPRFWRTWRGLERIERCFILAPFQIVEGAGRTASFLLAGDVVWCVLVEIVQYGWKRFCYIRILNFKPH